jgi:hypothetical protein
MVGTVRAVDTQARAIRVITGVGHSLRMMAFHAGEECRIVVDGRTAELRDVRRGAIVEIRYRPATGLHEADAIEAPPPSKDGGS